MFRFSRLIGSSSLAFLTGGVVSARGIKSGQKEKEIKNKRAHASFPIYMIGNDACALCSPMFRFSRLIGSSSLAFLTGGVGSARGIKSDRPGAEGH
jgi:hypothetical protein